MNIRSKHKWTTDIKDAALYAARRFLPNGEYVKRPKSGRTSKKQIMNSRTPLRAQDAALLASGSKSKNTAEHR